MGITNTHKKREENSTPFPWVPMMAISLALLSHSFAISSLFPYVGYMVQDLGMAKTKDEAGYYAGYIASAFMVGRVSSSYYWGSFSDTHGRKPGLYAALISLAVFSVAFGLSRDFFWAVACRFMLGVMNGIVAICRTMISEVCKKEHEVFGMGFVTGSWSIGFVIGPGMGGLLAQPAVHMPQLFSTTGLFGRYPYLLPNLLGAGMALLALPLVYFVLPETHHPANSKCASEARGGFKPLATSEGKVDAEAAIEEDEEECAVKPNPNPNPSQNPRPGGLSSAPFPHGATKDCSVTTDANGLSGVERRPAVGFGVGVKAVQGSGNGDPTVGNKRTNRNKRNNNDRKNKKKNDNNENNTSTRNREGGGGNGDRLEVSSPLLGREGKEGKGYSGVDGLVLWVGDQRGGAEEGGVGVSVSVGVEKGSPFSRFPSCVTLPVAKSTAVEITADIEEGTPDSDSGECCAEVLEEGHTGLRCCCLFAQGGILENPVTKWVLGTYCIFSFLLSGFDEAFPLWALSTSTLGGLDWTTIEIGQVLSFSGIGMVLFQFGVYPLIMKKLGLVWAQRSAWVLLIPLFVVIPSLSAMREGGVWLTVTVVAVMVTIRACANILFVTMALSTNACVPASQRGALNGLAMALGSVGKAAGPTLCSLIFAWSISSPSSSLDGEASNGQSSGGQVSPHDQAYGQDSRHFPLDYHLVFYTMSLSILMVAVASWVKIPVDIMSGMGYRDKLESGMMSTPGEREGLRDRVRDGVGKGGGFGTMSNCEK